MSKTKILNQMVKILCAKEKGKKQLNAGQAREAIKVFAELSYDNKFSALFYCYLSMIDAAKKKAKKKK